LKAKDFYRILSQVRGMHWELLPGSKPAFGVPSATWFIRGERNSFWYNPLTAVASCVRRSFVDRSTKTNAILHLDPRTFRRIHEASHQCVGYSPAVRRRLMKACRLTV
jgi:hypothetical protein